MNIDRIELYNYRNYKKECIKFKNALNIIVGENAQGKTNLLESIYFCSIAKSLRTTKDKDLILFGQERAKIKAFLCKNSGSKTIEIIISSNQKKSVKINELSILRIGDLLGELPSVYFSPDELRLIKDSPENRRRFLDISISQYNKVYFYSLLKYEKILMHRNKLIKESRNYEQIKDSLDIFTEQLINEASKIILERIKFIEKLKEPLNQIHKFLTDNKEEISISYIGLNGKSIEEIKQKLEKEFKKCIEKEFEQRHTLIGPHRDDLKIVVNDLDIRQFGSQGQQRTATLSLKLSELKILEESFGEKPILLLDDVLSELDELRKQKLLEFSSQYQTILACTEYKEKVKANLIKIKKGSVINENK